MKNENNKGLFLGDINRDEEIQLLKTQTVSENNSIVVGTLGGGMAYSVKDQFARLNNKGSVTIDPGSNSPHTLNDKLV